MIGKGGGARDEAWVVAAGVLLGVDLVGQALLDDLVERGDELGEEVLVAGDVAQDRDGAGLDVAGDPRRLGRDPAATEDVPILGSVTCNKAMLPQLRGALAEVQRLGLADTIHPDEYAGCYYPRYIGRDSSNGLSLHSWGIAVDLNVPGNLRGTVGEMDRTVVGVFKRWGFAWGGDWNYTDPMHFEMNAVVRTGR